MKYVLHEFAVSKCIAMTKLFMYNIERQIPRLVQIGMLKERIRTSQNKVPFTDKQYAKRQQTTTYFNGIASILLNVERLDGHYS